MHTELELAPLRSNQVIVSGYAEVVIPSFEVRKMKLSRRPITRTDVITVGLGAAAGGALGCIFGANIGGLPAALGLALLGSISGSLGGALFCFCRNPGSTRVSSGRVAILLFVLAIPYAIAGVVPFFTSGSSDRSSLTTSIFFTIYGFMCLAAKKKTNDTEPSVASDG